jgi:hypothetical protein
MVSKLPTMFCVTNNICTLSAVSALPTLITTVVTNDKVYVLQCFWALGACFEVLLALIVMPTLGWPWLLALSTIPLLAFAVITPVSAD